MWEGAVIPEPSVGELVLIPHVCLSQYATEGALNQS